jgi:hypothetical protein
MSTRRVIYPAATTPRTVVLLAAPQQPAVYTIRRPIAPADVKPVSTLGKRKVAPFEQPQHVDILRDSDGESDCDSEESISYDEIECENDLKKYTVEQHDGAPVRKRERLTHLSPEEKMWRRKMKNRIAAQTARDRKKARMDDIEDAVKKLERQNRDLVIENAKLRKQNAELMARMNVFEQNNAQLARVDDQNVSMNTMPSVESAVLINVLQQREQDSNVTLAQLITLLCTYVTLICSESSTSCSEMHQLSKQTHTSVSTLLETLTQQQRNHLAMNIRQLTGRYHHRLRPTPLSMTVQQ